MIELSSSGNLPLLLSLLIDRASLPSRPQIANIVRSIFYPTYTLITLQRQVSISLLTIHTHSSNVKNRLVARHAYEHQHTNYHLVHRRDSPVEPKTTGTGYMSIKPSATTEVGMLPSLSGWVWGWSWPSAPQRLVHSTRRC